MKSFRVIADSSCLIGLAQIKQFELLKQLFLEVSIPQAVYDEVVVIGSGETGSEETATAVKEGWLKNRAVNDEVAISALTPVLSKGESEVIVLCKELGFEYALIDEKTARNMAEIMGVNTMGVIGIINLAVDRGLPIDKKKLVDQLIDSGFRISKDLYKKIFPEL